MKKLFIVLLILPLFFGCKKDKDSSISKGYVVFNNQINSIGLKSASNDFDKVAYAVLTIADGNGTVIKESEKIELYKFEGAILSFPLELNVGTYNLTDFYLVDSVNNVLFAAPKEGSKLANYVADPLGINFEISADNETKTTVEVLSTVVGSMEDFGYSEFDAIPVKTFDIVVSAFKYDSAKNLFELTDGIIEIAGTDFSVSDSLMAINNIVKIKDGLDSYQIILKKDDIVVYNKSFSLSELKAFGIEYLNPLKIYIGSTDITLQPGSEGKDAFIANYNPTVDYPNTNFGYYREFTALAWTNSGTQVLVRSLIDFDLSEIPTNAKIISATLNLFAVNNTVNSSDGGHSQLSGSNACFLQKITSPWEESGVTWNNQPSVDTLNQIEIPASTNKMQNYQIDITTLIQQSINNPSTAYGFMIKLVTEEYYRKLIFASSDYADSTKRPQLNVKYVN